MVCPDGYEYYEMLVVYVNDILSISHQTKEAISKVTKYYRAKDDVASDDNVIVIWMRLVSCIHFEKVSLHLIKSEFW